MSLQQALAFTLREEGGYVDNPNDSGGATDHGITQATYDDYRDGQKAQHQDVKLITDAEVEAIYEYMYWNPAKCPFLPSHLGICHFDWAVNHGISGAIKTLQQALGIEADGIWGPQSAAAVTAAGDLETCRTYNALRRQWYKQRVVEKPSQEEFLAGWLKRVDKLDSYLLTI